MSTPDDLARRLAKQLEARMFAEITGPQRPQRQTALRLRGNRLETVELDAAGNIIEPPARCCHGTVLHAPNCKRWMTCT